MMTLKELIEKTGWEVLTKAEDDALPVTGGFVGDLLSWVMGHGESGQAWITVQGHVNVIAVAVLKEFSCIILANEAEAEDAMLMRAKDEGIAVLRCQENACEAARRLIASGL